MNRKILSITICLLILTQIIFSQVSQDRLHYIEKYSQIAQDEMERTGVPASIKLAQAILESNGGKSVLSRKANNHFGIKCGGDWNGRSFYRVDDEKDNKGNTIESCFRVYKNPESSFIAHSEFLRGNQRYAFLFELDHKDYNGWAYGLKKAGYATNPKYPSLLIKIVENYNLSQYDNLFEPAEPPMFASTDDTSMLEEIARAENRKVNKAEDKKVKFPSHKTVEFSKLNDISVVYAKADETPEIIAIKTDVPLRRIFRYNEGLTDPSQAIPENTVVFLQPKRKAFRGRKKFHQVTDGETMAQITQKYGIQLDQLQRRNRLAVNEEPLGGAILKIRGRRVPSNMKIPTREVFVAGQTNRESENKKVEKYATSLSDFEAPPAMELVEEKPTKPKNKKLFSFGKKRELNEPQNSTKPTDIYKASPAYVESDIETVKESTDVYTSPSTTSSESYNTETNSANATFKENLPQSTTTITTSEQPTATITTSESITTYNKPNSATGLPSTTSQGNISTPPSGNYNTYSSSTSPSTSEVQVSTTTTYAPTTSSSSYYPSTSSATSTPSSESTVVTTNPTVATQYHTVTAGQTLYRLSKMYGKSVEYIKTVNGLNSNTISIGQKLIVN